MALRIERTSGDGPPVGVVARLVALAEKIEAAPWADGTTQHEWAAEVRRIAAAADTPSDYIDVADAPAFVEAREQAEAVLANDTGDGAYDALDAIITAVRGAEPSPPPTSPPNDAVEALADLTHDEVMSRFGPQRALDLSDSRYEDEPEAVEALRHA